MRKRCAVWFAIGLLLGVGVMFLRCEGGGRRFDRSPDRIVAILERKLDLDAEQSKKVREIVTTAAADLAALKTEVRPRFDQIRQRTKTAIASELNDTQRAEFEVLSKEWEERRKQWRGQ